MYVANILATVGAILSMISNVPQVYKVRTLHSTSDIHSYSIILHLFAACTWSVYGFWLQLYILGIESGIVALLNFFILIAIIRDRCIYREVHDSKDVSTPPIVNC